jgi:multiple sugar transport system substrate-binding protein
MDILRKISMGAAAAALCFLLSVTGMGRDAAAQEKQITLSVWSYSDELRDLINRFEAENRGITVELSVMQYEDYLNKLLPVLKAKESTPDVFVGESGIIGNFLKDGIWEDLTSAPYKADVSDMFPYMIDAARDSGGKLRALGWQVWIGGFYYRRSLAKQYLGTDDPEKIGEMLSTEDKFIATGLRLKDKSRGKIKLLAGWEDYMRYALAAREHAFVDDSGHFVPDDAVVRLFAVAKVLHEQKLTAGCRMWSPDWFDGMQKENDAEIFGYSFPLWGFTYILKNQASHTDGDWAVCRGPQSYFWGGSWLGINSNSKNKAAAWEFIRFVTLNRDTLEWWANEKKECVNSKTVMNKLKNEMTDVFLAGQKYFKYFYDEAPKINGNLLSTYDTKIEPLLTNAIVDYLEGGGASKDAIRRFIREVHEEFPEIDMEEK